MVRSVLTFTLRPGQRDEFVDTFRRLGVLEISSFQPGFLGAQLHLDLADPDLALVTATWESAAAYQGWLDNPVRDTLSAELDPLLIGEPRGGLFERAHEVGPQTPAPSGAV